MSVTKARVFAVCLVLSAGVAAAQTPEEVRRDAQIHLGVFYVTPRFAVKEFGVDTNVFNSTQPQRDFTFTVTPSAKVSTPFGRRAVATVHLGGDVVYYQHYASERSLNPAIDVHVDGFLGHFEPFVEASYLRSRQRPNFEIDARSLREEDGYAAGVRAHVSPRTSVTVRTGESRIAYAADALFNDVSLQQTLNRTTTRYAIEGRYDLTPLTTLVLTSESVRDRFEFSPLRDADSVAVLPGVELEARALISGSARVGVRRFKPITDTLERFSGVVAAATLTYTLAGATRFTVTADRDLTYSYEPVQPYFVTDAYGLIVRRQIVGLVDVTGSVQRQRYSYRDLLLPGATAADLHRVDTTRTYVGSIGYRVGHAMRAGFGTAYRERGSNSLRFRDYQGFRFITTIDYEF